MATQFDVRNDTQPQLKYRRSSATHAALDTAILASAGGYTQAILNTMTKNDKAMVVHDRNLTVAGGGV